jgi:ATP-dependent RNA helicase DeaD
MSSPGAEILESEEREATTGRSQNVVHILPQSMDSVPRFLTGPLERIEPLAGGVQLVVVTSDAESAVALAEAVLKLTGPGGIELFPVTTARRATRLMQSRPVLAIAGSPGDLADLVRGSNLKLTETRTLVLAWADDSFDGDVEATSALELLMTELPKEAARMVVTDRADQRVDDFVERYLRRARRMDEQEARENVEPVDIQFLTVSPTSRLSALRRLLDDLDPPSAEIIVGSDETEADVSALLRTLGYPDGGTVKVSRGNAVPATHAVIFFGMPASRKLMGAAAAVSPVATVALIQPREVRPLRRMAGGEVKPLTFPNAGKTVRDRERALRRELSGILDSGMPAREILTLEPLLESHDGIEIAAAALRLLERERAIQKSIEAAAAAAAPKPAPPRTVGFERSGPPRDRPSGGPRSHGVPGGPSAHSRGGRDDARPRDRAPRGDRPFRDAGPPEGRSGGRPSGRPSGPPGSRDRRPPSRPGSGGRPPRDQS